MNFSAQEIGKIINGGLTQSSINSFKWGNTPAEETRIRATIIQLYPHAKHELFGSGYDVNNKPIEVSEGRVYKKLAEWVNECETLEDIEKLNARLHGQ